MLHWLFSKKLLSNVNNSFVVSEPKRARKSQYSAHAHKSPIGFTNRSIKASSSTVYFELFVCTENQTINLAVAVGKQKDNSCWLPSLSQLGSGVFSVPGR